MKQKETTPDKYLQVTVSLRSEDVALLDLWAKESHRARSAEIRAMIQDRAKSPKK